MAKTFLQIQSELATLIQNKAFSALSSGRQTSLKLRINMTQDYIVSWPRQIGRQWPFLRGTGYITTVAKHTTGNINVTQYSANVAGGTTSPVFTSAMVGRLLIVSGGTEAYRIKTFTSATAIVLETPYLQSTATNQSYSIVKDLYTLASDFNGMVKGTVKPDSELTLDYMTETEWEDTFFNSTRIGTPLYYGLPGAVASGTDKGLHQIWLREGYPETVMGIQYKYYKMLPALSDDADVSLISYMQGGDNAVILGSIWFLRQHEREAWSTADIEEAKRDFMDSVNTLWQNSESLTEDKVDKLDFSGYLDDDTS